MTSDQPAWVWDGKHASYRKTMPNLSVPDETVLP